MHDQDPRQTVVDIIKSKLLDNLEREVPFNLQPVIQMWQVNETGTQSFITPLSYSLTQNFGYFY